MTTVGTPTYCKCLRQLTNNRFLAPRTKVSYFSGITFIVLAGQPAFCFVPPRPVLLCCKAYHPSMAESARSASANIGGRLVSYVTSRLRLDWPPEAVAGRLNVDYPDDASMRTCRMGRFLEMVNLSLVRKDHLPSQEGDLRHESRISVVSESSVLIN